MGYFTIACAGYTVSLDDTSVAEAEQAPHSLRLLVGQQTTWATSALKLTTNIGDTQQNTLYVLDYGAPSMIDERSAVCLRGNVVFLAGSYVVCMTPTLDRVIWTLDCDEGSCFGVYVLADSEELIVHCELAIMRLTSAGTVRWRACGRDIFTGPFRIGKSAIRATDFYDTEYSIRLDTGETQIIRRGSQ